VTSEDEKSLVEQALDAFVYAPLGLLLEARDLIPKMADRGRGQVALVRLAGKVAQNRSLPPRTTTPTVESIVDDKSSSPSLPIEDYDDLSAPQLLPKLESLQSSELQAVLAHEEAHRARATVLNRIHQLRG